MRKAVVAILAVLMLAGGGIDGSAFAQDAPRNWQYEATVVAGPSTTDGQDVAAYVTGSVYRQFTPHVWAGVAGNTYTRHGGVSGLFDLGDSELGKNWTMGLDVGYTLDANGEPSFNTGWFWARVRIDRIKDNDMQIAVTVKNYDEAGGPINLKDNTFIGVGIVKRFEAFPGLGN